MYTLCATHISDDWSCNVYESVQETLNYFLINALERNDALKNDAWSPKNLIGALVAGNDES